MPQAKKQVFMPSRKSNIIYENWKVHSIHGKLMFRCSEKKAQWYLKRNLATIMKKEEEGNEGEDKKSESRSIKLNFEAKGDGHKIGDYMMEDRTNMCVSCASRECLTLHHVVPEMYRQWMPLCIKSRSSRDILPLCKICHDGYESKAMVLKKQGVKRFGIPLEGSGWINLPKHKVAKKAASAILRSSNKIPPKRQEELKQIVQDFWKEYSNADDEKKDWNEVLQTCSILEDHYKGPKYKEHGNSVVEQLMEKRIVEVVDEKERGRRERWPDLEDFIKLWRQHFLEHVKPKYLSRSWTVDAEIYNNNSPIH